MGARVEVPRKQVRSVRLTLEEDIELMKLASFEGKGSVSEMLRELILKAIGEGHAEA